MSARSVTRLPKSLAVLVVVSVCATSEASLWNVAAGKPVIGGSGVWSNAQWDVSPANYSTFNVTDNGSGSITETPGDDSYWLGRQGYSTGHFVLDLGSAVPIVQIQLFNTANGGIDDRGTGRFSITASNSITYLGSSQGYNLAGATTIIPDDPTRPLTVQHGTYVGPTFWDRYSVLVPDAFDIPDLGPFRYLRFDALSVGASNDTSGVPANQGVGLNEIRVFTTPEPSTLLIWSLLGTLAVTVGWWRRRKAA